MPAFAVTQYCDTMGAVSMLNPSAINVILLYLYLSYLYTYTCYTFVIQYLYMPLPYAESLLHLFQCDHMQM